MRVRKRNGDREEFVREKIVLSVVGAGGNLRRARNIAREVERKLSGRAVVETELIKGEVLERLRSRDSRAYRGWLAYDRQNKRR